MYKEKLKKIKENEYELPKIEEMLVPGKIFFSDEMIKNIEEESLKQVKNVACLSGIQKYSIGLADMHVGYGFPIGGVAAFDIEEGIVSPGGVGYDINCSVLLLRTNLTKEDILEKQEETALLIQRKIPSGVGRGSPFNISKKEFLKVLERGAKYLIEKGYGKKEDYLYLEEEGCLTNAKSEKVSERALKRGIGQLGTLGAGNHFVDVQYVDEIFDKEISEIYGLKKNQIVIMIHCGSRGLGHQIASDYIQLMEKEYGIKNLPDRELINAPVKSKLGQDYLNAMACAANFAFANKQLMLYWLREELKKIFPKIELEVVYEVCHNIAKIEEYLIDGKRKKVCVHRKGATRAFGPGRKEVPLDYRKAGQPVLIPGSMGTASYVLAGTKKAEELTFGSTVHGAGRIMGRRNAIRNLKYENLIKDLREKGIIVKSGSQKSLLEESPEAYKNIDEVVSVVHNLGISKKVAKLQPLIVIIG